MLEGRHLHKSYNTKKAKLHVLRGITVAVEPGEMLSLLGASGAGKSTLLHILGGLDVPTQGEVLLNGQNLYTIKDTERASLRNREIGFVFQFYYLMPEFTALENVMLPGLIAGYGRGEVQDKALRLLSQVGLEKRKTHYPAELSGGEQQRVAIARALINDPKVLLCDEPTGNLDSKTGEKICGLLSELHREKAYTIIIATHSEKVAAVSSRVMCINDGLLAEKGG